MNIYSLKNLAGIVALKSSLIISQVKINYDIYFYISIFVNQPATEKFSLSFSYLAAVRENSYFINIIQYISDITPVSFLSVPD